ncbi:trypsin-like serine peptidase [Jannaschia formosa]|uniref:trypsin-like serine peptidase n=1 Tax=Jannaschia formosa TaxID=2259592 RepID=UPI000E1BBE39|nr:trypsin-like peptidase domain-containing protein [Jannaschia formosa]TFL16474.1 trypsin-like serine protease [Jannaschia formosa]
MRPFLAILAACLTLGAPLAASADGLRPLATAAEISGFEAVGRVDHVSDTEQGFCTGTLITRSLVLTAAHCLTRKDGMLHDPETLRFRAGLRLGLAKSERGVRRFTLHPSYRHEPDPTGASVAHDLALLELDRPLDYWTVPPLQTTTGLERGQSVQVISYAQDREDTPSQETACSVLGRTGPVLALDCQATYGASGAPVFVATPHGLKIVSVVSAIGLYDGERATFAVEVADAVPTMIRAFPPQQAPARVAVPGSRTLRPGDRAGASGTIRFLRPGG